MSLFIETFAVEQGTVARLKYHCHRLANTCRAMGYTDHTDKFLNILSAQHFPINTTQRLRGRILYDAQGIHDFTLEPYVPRHIERLRLVEVDSSFSYTFKSAQRHTINDYFEQRGSCDDVLLLKEGQITDTSIANVAFFDPLKHAWFTPECPLLAGTHRQALLETEKILPLKDCSLSSLKRFTRLRLFNALLHWGEIDLPLSSIYK